jgi:hypothetical protein
LIINVKRLATSRLVRYYSFRLGFVLCLRMSLIRVLRNLKRRKSMKNWVLKIWNFSQKFNWALIACLIACRLAVQLLETSYHSDMRINIPEEWANLFQSDTSIYYVGTIISYRLTSVLNLHRIKTFLGKLPGLKDLNFCCVCFTSERNFSPSLFSAPCKTERLLYYMRRRKSIPENVLLFIRGGKSTPSFMRRPNNSSKLSGRSSGTLQNRLVSCLSFSIRF